MENIEEKQFYEYFIQYLNTTYCLSKTKNIEFFYPLISLYSTLVEVFIKFCIISYSEGINKNYTIKNFNLDTDNGIKKEEIENLIKDINFIISKLGNKNLSIYSRFPIDKNNNIIIKKIDDNVKIKIFNIIINSCEKISLLMLNFNLGEIDNLDKKIKILIKFINSIKT